MLAPTKLLLASDHPRYCRVINCVYRGRLELSFGRVEDSLENCSLQMGCCAIVPEAHIGVVERFGKFDRTEHPGCVCLIPCVTDVSGMVPLNVRQLNVRVETKTSDNVFVIMEVSVQYEAIPEKVVCKYGPERSRNIFRFSRRMMLSIVSLHRPGR